MTQGFSHVVAFPLIDARTAVATAVRELFREQEFTVWGGGAAPNRKFKLNSVERVWPDPSKPLNVPMAVVLDDAPAREEAFNFVPAPLEDTWDRKECTVLWKTAELVGVLQVNFWLGNEPEREAVAAALPSLFSPNEDQYGRFVETSDAYFCRPCRLSYQSASRPDEAGSIYPRERRLQVSIGFEIDVVDRRSAVESIFDASATVLPST